MPQDNSQDKTISRKDAWKIGVFFGALALVAGWFGRGYSVGGFIPVPLFVGALATFFIVNVARAARRD